MAKVQEVPMNRKSIIGRKKPRSRSPEENKEEHHHRHLRVTAVRTRSTVKPTSQHSLAEIMPVIKKGKRIQKKTLAKSKSNKKANKRNTSKGLKKEKEIESESEEENESSSDEKLNSDISINESEEKSEEKPIVKRKRKEPASKQTKQSSKKLTKPKKPNIKQRKVNKKSIEESSEDEKEEEEETVTNNKKKGSKGSSSSISIKSLPLDTYSHSKKTTLITDCCMQCNEKNIFRAIETNDKKLFEQCLKETKEISSVTSANSIADFKTPFQFALIKNNKDIVSSFINYFKKKHSRAIKPSSSLQSQETGHTFLYGSRMQHFNLSRGNRLGNNAFLDQAERDVLSINYGQNKANSIKTFPFHDDTIFKNFKSFTKLIQLNDDEISKLIYENLDKGNFEIMCFLMQSLKNPEMFGFNKVHVQICQSDKKDFDIKNKQSTNKLSSLRVTPVHFACVNPDANILKELLEKGGEAEIQDMRGKKPIAYAAACQSDGPLKLLIKNKCNVNDREKNGYTPLLYAVKEGRIANVKLLIENGANISHRSRPGACLAIHIACIKGYFDIVKYLIEKDTSMINITGADRKTSLHFAVIHGHEEIVEFLVKSGASINAKDKLKRTSLLLACRFGYSRILNYLIKQDAKISLGDNSNNSPLHYACAFGHFDCVKLLIEAGAEVSKENMWKSTPIEIALMKNHFGLVKFLINCSNYDINSKFGNGNTILLHILGDINPSSYEELSYIIKEKKADVNIYDDNKLNPLHMLSAFTYRKYLINFLSNKEKNELNEKNHKVHRKEYNKLLKKVIGLLIDSGCNANWKNMLKQLPIITAVTTRNYDYATELLKYTTDVYELDINDLSIFDHCSHNGRILIEECLDFVQEMTKSHIPTADFLNKETRYGNSALLAICECFAKNIYSKYYHLNKIEAVPFIMIKKVRKTQNTRRPLRNQGDKFYIPDNARNKIKQKTLQGIQFFINERFLPLLQRLLYLGANPNQQSGVRHFKNSDKYTSEYYNNFGKMTPLMYLLALPMPMTIRSFIEVYKIDVNAKDNLGKTALFYLISHYYKQIRTISTEYFDKTFEFLIDAKGIDLKTVDNNNNSAFLLCVLTPYEKGALDLYKKDPSINVNLVNNQKIHPLLYYMNQKNFNKTMVQFLLENFPIDVNCKDSVSRTALHHATINNSSNAQIDYSLFTSLFKANADINAEDNDQCTPLFYLFINKTDDPIVMLSYLLEHAGDKININKTDIYGNTVLFYAIKQHATFSISALLSKGADPKLVNKDGNNPCAYSIIHESTSITEVYSKIGNAIEFEKDYHEEKKRKEISENTDENKKKKEETVDSFFTDKKNQLTPFRQQYTNYYNYQMENNENNVEEIDYRLEKFFANGEEDNNEEEENTSGYVWKMENEREQKDNEENWKEGNDQDEDDDNDDDEESNGIFNEAKNMKDEEEADDNEDEDEDEENKEESDKDVDMSDYEEDYNQKQISNLEDNKEQNYNLCDIVERYSFNYPNDMNRVVSQFISKKLGKSPFNNSNETIEVNKIKKALSDDENSDDDDDDNNSSNDDDNESSDDDNYEDFKMDNDNNNKKKPIIINAKTITSIKSDNNKKKKEKYSLFSYCIQRNLQVYLFYMINQGYSIFKACEEAIKFDKFTFCETLVDRYANSTILKQKNKNNQSLLHLLCKCICTQDNTQVIKLYKLFTQFLDIKEVDNKLNTPLHYACKSINPALIPLLTKNFTDMSQFNQKNKKAISPLDYLYQNFNEISDLSLIVKITNSLKQGIFNKITKKLAQIYVKEMYPDFNKKKIETNIQAKDYNHNLIALYQILMSNGSSLMAKDKEGNDSLCYCVIYSNQDLFHLLINESTIAHDSVNNKGKSLIHLLVSIDDTGSYQNVDFLTKALINGFRADIKDSDGKLPIDYAIEHKYTLLENVLRKYSTPSSSDKMDIDQEYDFNKGALVSFTNDYRKDANEYYTNVILPMVAKSSENNPAITYIDNHCKLKKDNYIICKDSDGQLYNADLNKVESKKWNEGVFVFYKLQLVHNIKKDMYTLITRWGEIGEIGQFQKTPFPTREDGEKEFKSVFKSKSGNSWESVHNNTFVFIPGKYNYQKINKIDEIYDHVRNEGKKLVIKTPSKINKDLFDLLKLLITNPFLKDPTNQNKNIYRSRYYGNRQEINATIEMVYFEKETLSKAFEYLDQMALIIDKVNNNKEKINKTNINEKNLADEASDFNKIHQENEDYRKQLIGLSDLYYQLIPIMNNGDFYMPIVSSERLAQESSRVKSFSYNEHSLKLFLGAISNLNGIHPIDYIYHSLKTTITPMPLKCEGEMKALLNYIALSCQNNIKIMNIFKLHSPEKEEKFMENKLDNRVLLFHGTKARNLLGIISQGLLIAPVTARQTGESYGKGIYLTDSFHKASNYSEGNTMNKGYVLICDAALGKVCQMTKQKQFKSKEDLLKQKYDSMISYAVNHMDFNSRFYLNNGSATFTKFINEKNLNHNDYQFNNNLKTQYRLDNDAEYVVYNSNQVMVKYIIEFQGK